MFIHEYFAYNEALAEERALEVASRLLAEEAVAELNAGDTRDWRVIVRVNVQIED